MDSMRSLNTSLPGTSATKQPAQNDPEQLLDAFKAAALSVTKLYKTSATAQSKARMDGYQDCLDDLLAFLDKEKIGLSNGDGWKIRNWATERFEGRDGQTPESDDEADKPETTSSPGLNRLNSESQLEETQMKTDSAPSTAPQPIEEEEPEIMPITVPTQDTFTFQSSHPWPPQAPQQDAYLNLANLDLSDSRTHDNTSTNNVNTASRAPRPRHPASGPRTTSRQGSSLGRGAGSKRKINFAEIFDLSSLDKNMFGGGPKRSRHT
ncbi:hypothetical protein CPLU01_02093 [Colletotrichum plurivorum]|uniref:Uncharacterized protein n=1 Tax=Colletotrichum plurivorum TaxID=2175906 RepID=A0A8H6KWQ7_9PEZI|nr:hypothetical protein CPLU01_02093 [Colletotrichum plurivorum]